MDNKKYNETINQIVTSEEKIMETSQLLKSIINGKNIAKYKTKKNKFNLVIVCGTAVLAIIVILSVYIFRVTNTNNKIIDSLSDGTFKQTVQLSDGELFFNQTETISKGDAKLVIPQGKIEKWTFEQVNDYMGKNVKLEYIPQKLIENNLNELQDVYIREDGTVSFDNFTYYYSENLNSSETAGLIIIISKGKMPITDEVFSITETSNINGTRLSITCVNEMSYYASFMYDGIGYRIQSSQISQEDFIKVLLSIIK